MKKIIILLLIFILIIVTFISYLILNRLGYIPKKVYYASNFNIDIVKSEIDYNNNGIDDYTDILNGAKKEAKNRPKYKSNYYDGGYPPSDEGVCTDLVWRSLKEAGYDLKELIDNDIKNNLDDYTNITYPDTNIDFRRVKNIKVFLERNTINLTLDINDIGVWQPGDIVTFSDNHIAIISDKRNKSGIPYIIHNANNFHKMEEDKLAKYGQISGHFRFKLKYT